MPEGLSVSQVGVDISETTTMTGEESENYSNSRVLMVIEAVLLAVVAVLAAYSGFAASSRQPNPRWRSRKRRRSPTRPVEPNSRGSKPRISTPPHSTCGSRPMWPATRRR